MPPYPPSLILCIWVQVSVQAEAMQFCLRQDCVFVSMLNQRHHTFHDDIDARSCFQGVSARRGYPHEGLINFQLLHGPTHALYS